MPFPPVPNEIKPIAHYMKVAEEHDSRNLVVSYWSRMYACQIAMKIVPGKKSPEVSAFLISVMDWLEKTKKENRDLDGISDEVAAQAIIEEYVIQLFNFADSQDQAEIFNKNTVKAFYTTGILLDVLQQFGDLSEDLQEKRKYAKYKAAYIHHCLKIGDEPISGPPVNDTYGDASDDEDTPKQAERPEPPQPPTAQQPQPQIPSPSIPSLPNVPTPAAREPQVHYVPSTDSSTESAPKALETGALLSQEQLEKAQKYCKWATSALNYDDVKTAADNLQKALKLLQTGQDS